MLLGCSLIEIKVRSSIDAADTLKKLLKMIGNTDLKGRGGESEFHMEITLGKNIICAYRG